MNSSMSNIVYLASRLTRYISNPTKDYWKALIRVFIYLKYTINYSLHYTSYLPILEKYSYGTKSRNIY